ncbi:MAG: nitroreductase family protein [Clostridia bacterium]|nr:nitroreductase family protein [Clostridia bacterium]
MDLKKLYEECRTFRRFKQDEISKADITEALDMARISSCGMNAQKLRYIAVLNKDTVAKMQPLVKWAGFLPKELGTPKENECPTAYIAVLKSKDAGAFIDVDLGIATNTIVTMLYSKGIGSCILGSVNVAEAEKLLEVPEDLSLRLVIGIGYPDHKSSITEVTDDLKYRMDENRDYVVPKLDFDKVVKII